jgi:hypothetical protein
MPLSTTATRTPAPPSEPNAQSRDIWFGSTGTGSIEPTASPTTLHAGTGSG